MKLTSVLLTIFLAVVLQVTLARYTVGGRWVFDMVVVGVVFAALQWGPVAGILGGTMAGLTQDMVAGQIIGVGGLAKTIVGFLVGVVGTQFVVARPYARTVIVAIATFAHRFLMIGLHGLIDQQWPAVPWGAILGEIGLNSLGALVVFQMTAALPGMMERQRASRRSSLSKRQW